MEKDKKYNALINTKKDSDDENNSDARYLELETKDKDVSQDTIGDISDIEEIYDREGYSAELSRDLLNSWSNKREERLQKFKKSKFAHFFNSLKVLARKVLSAIGRTSSALLWPTYRIKQNFDRIKRSTQEERDKILDKQREINRLITSRRKTLLQRNQRIYQQNKIFSKIKSVILKVAPILGHSRFTTMQHAQHNFVSTTAATKININTAPLVFQISTKYTANEQQSTKHTLQHHNEQAQGISANIMKESPDKNPNIADNTLQDRENRVSFLFPPSQPTNINKIPLNTSPLANYNPMLNIRVITPKPIVHPKIIGVAIVVVKTVEFVVVQKPSSAMHQTSQFAQQQNIPEQSIMRG